MDGYAENCYLIDTAPSRLQGKLLAQRWPRSDQDSRSNQDASTTNRWDRGKIRLQLHPKGPSINQPEEKLVAGQEGHNKLLGKAGDSEDLNDVLPPEPTQCPTALYLPLAGLRDYPVGVRIS